MGGFTESKRGSLENVRRGQDFLLLHGGVRTLSYAFNIAIALRELVKINVHLESYWKLRYRDTEK